MVIPIIMCLCGHSYKIVLTVASGEKVTVVDRQLTAVLLFNPWNSGQWL